MATVLIYAEHKDGKIKKVTHELIAEAARSGAEPVAFIAGSGIEAFAAELAGMGAKRVLAAQGDAVKFYSNEAYGKLFAAAVKTVNPAIILMGASDQGKDLAPRVAAILGVGLASDCTKVKIEGDKLNATRPIYAGKALADVEFTGGAPYFATVRPNALSIGPTAAGATAAITALPLDLGALKSAVKELVKSATAKLDVTEANIVVSGGRSLKSAENFGIIEKLAASLPNAAVGASRAAVDAGYRPHSDQVGQTGKVVSPTLYIACGISGAIQHLAGMRTSKVIVAINKDPEAPIFQLADYGIVGDLFEVVPALTEEFKKALS
ncbi:MAG: electron transfer flavoprotein subunit alpha/FixB family protein [Deltaproteobacteria bacterium]|nr:electron transfer flavoprotein subunit alpha/FixB family protein [Deltaproteobacteria bacterium]